jgi:hypothetical protein
LSVLAAVVVTAVAAVAVFSVVQSRLQGAREPVPTTGDGTGTAPSDPAGSGPPATPAVPPPPATPLDAVLAQAAAGTPVAPDTQALLDRVPTLQTLSGPSRAEEAADIYGLAVAAARSEEPPGPATALADALRPEVDLPALLTLAERRPAVVGPGVAPLVDDFTTLPTVSGSAQRAQAQDLLDAVVYGQDTGTISPGFCNVALHVLGPYLRDA